MNKSYIIGLDISTATIGWCVMNKDDDKDFHLGHITLNPKFDFWDKFDQAKLELSRILELYNIVSFGVEEAVLGFQPGFSSAGVIITLSKFNAVICAFMRECLAVKPFYCKTNAARKFLGIPLTTKKKCGKSQKEQTIDWLVSRGDCPLKFLSIETTKTGKLKPWVGDRVDAYVVCHYTHKHG